MSEKIQTDNEKIEDSVNEKLRSLIEDIEILDEKYVNLKKSFLSAFGDGKEIPESFLEVESVISLIKEYRSVGDQNHDYLVLNKYRVALEGRLKTAEDSLSDYDEEVDKTLRSEEMLLLYKNGESAVFRNEKGVFKSIQEIKADIDLVLNNHDAGKVDILKKELSLTFKKISHLNVQKGKETNSSKKAKIKAQISSEYATILTMVGDFLKEKERDEKNNSNDSVPENLPTADAFEERVESALSEYESYLKILNPNNYADFANLPSLSKVNSLLNSKISIKDGSTNSTADLAFLQGRQLDQLEKRNLILKEEVQKILSLEKVSSVDELLEVVKNIGDFKNGNVTQPVVEVVSRIENIKSSLDIKLADVTDIVSAALVLESVYDKFGETVPFSFGLRFVFKNILENYIENKFANVIPEDTAGPVNSNEKQSSIENLLDGYKNSDPGVFTKTNDGGKLVYKRFSEVTEDIDSVLALAGIDKDKINATSEKIHFTYWARIKDLNTKLGGDMLKPENAAARKRLKQEIANEYNEILTLVSNILNGTEVKNEEKKEAENIPNSPLAEDPTKNLEKYEELRKKHLEVKSAYQEAETKYNLALQQYYHGGGLMNVSSFLHRKKLSLHNLMGISPSLPDEIKEMSLVMSRQKQAYAESLDEVLQARAGSRASNKEYVSVAKDEAKEVKEAFVRKFVIKPNEKSLQYQESNLDPTQKKSLGRISSFLLKNQKNLYRLGVITMTATVGAVSGGVGGFIAAGSYKALRVAGGAILGGSIGSVANMVMEDGVIDSKNKLSNKAEEFVSGGFDLTKLDESNKDYQAAQNAVARAKARQKAVTVAAAVAAGGSMGYLDGAFGAEATDHIADKINVEVDEIEDSPHVHGRGNPLEPHVPRAESTPVQAVVSSEVLANGDGPEVEKPSVAINTEKDIYEVKRGDTLVDVVNNHFREQLNKVPAEDYNKVLYQLLDRVQDSEELQKSLGMRSDDIDLIYTGEKLNLSSLDSELAKIIAENNGEVTEVAEAANPPISGDKIFSGSFEDTPKAAPVLDSLMNNGSDFEMSLAKPDFIIPPSSGQYLDTAEYKQYAENVFGSEENLNKAVNTFSSKVTDGSYSILDKMLGPVYEDPFVSMSGMTIAELENLKGDMFNGFSTAEARAFCSDNNLKYESFLDWRDKIDEIKNTGLEYQPNTTLKDLVSRFVIENRVSELSKK